MQHALRASCLGYAINIVLRVLFPHKLWQIINDGVRGQNTLVRSMSLPKKPKKTKKPYFEPTPRFSLPPAFIHYDAPLEKGASNSAQLCLPIIF